MKKHILPIIVILCGVAALLCWSAVTAHAQPVDAGAPAVTDAGTPDAGSGSTTPAAALHNPVDDPLAAIEDAKAAKKQGWAFVVLASLVMLTAGAARAVAKWPDAPVIAAINKHKTAILIIGCASAGAVAAYNALALGGSWIALLYAGAGAALTFVSPKSNPAPAAPTAV
jgi:hypothetical protein